MSHHPSLRAETTTGPAGDLKGPDREALSRQLGLRHSERLLASYSYAFLRLLELKSGWLNNIPDIDFKVILGESMGMDGRRLVELTGRRGEMMSEPLPRASSQEYAAQFEVAASLTDRREISQFIVGVLADVRQAMEDHVASLRPTADAPTSVALSHALAEIDDAIGTFTNEGGGRRPVESIRSISEEVECYACDGKVPPFPEWPGRDPRLLGADASAIANFKESFSSLEGMKRLTFFIYMDIEVPAMEVCARNIIQYRDMPLDFKADMARQIWDEARHAMLLRERLYAMGGDETSYGITDMLWKRYLLGTDLAERLTIQQVIQEGNALDANFVGDTFRKGGDYVTADIADFINADETVHAGIGNKWLLRLCGNSEQKYEAYIRSCCSKLHVNMPQHPGIDPAMRRYAGFPEWFIEKFSDSTEHIKGRPE